MPYNQLNVQFTRSLAHSGSLDEERVETVMMFAAMSGADEVR